MGLGMVKVNENRTIRDGYHRYLEQNSSRADLTKLQEEGVEIYSQGVERYMVEVFKSAGKA